MMWLIKKNAYCIMNLLKNNIIIIGLLVIIFTVYIAITYQDTYEKLSIKFTKSAIVFHPESKSTVEGYQIEYATPENIGKELNIIVSWVNGVGFGDSKVSSFIIKRKIKDVYLNVRDKETTMIITDTELLKDNAVVNVTVEGKYINEESGVVGTNIIEVYYTTSSSPTLKLLGKTAVEIKDGDLDNTINITSVPDAPKFKTPVFLSDIFENKRLNIKNIGANKVIASKVTVKRMDDGSEKLVDMDGDQVKLGWRHATYNFEKYFDYYIIKEGTGYLRVTTGGTLMPIPNESDFFKPDKINFGLFDVSIVSPKDSYTKIYGSGSLWEHGTSYTSPNGVYKLQSLDIGHLALNRVGSGFIWSSLTAGRDFKTKFSEGHLFIWDTKNNVSRKTISFPENGGIKSYLALADDGSFTMRDTQGKIVSTISPSGATGGGFNWIPIPAAAPVPPPIEIPVFKAPVFTAPSCLIM